MKTRFSVEACTHPLSVRRQGKTRECTSSLSYTLSCRLRPNGAVDTGCQSHIIALVCYHDQVCQENIGRAHRRFLLVCNTRPFTFAGTATTCIPWLSVR